MHGGTSKESWVTKKHKSEQLQVPEWYSYQCNSLEIGHKDRMIF